jgi:hypothetical protein
VPAPDTKGNKAVAMRLGQRTQGNAILVSDEILQSTAIVRNTEGCHGVDAPFGEMPKCFTLSFESHHEPLAQVQFSDNALSGAQPIPEQAAARAVMEIYDDVKSLCPELVCQLRE